ncbi:MAG: hypothetical protein J5I50_12670 [Chitinophagaceae bacterium]|nr:hypothetical protein [Chitinophagaceae bacterium]
MKRDSLGFTEYYQSKKKLDGFTLTMVNKESKSYNTTNIDKTVDGENKPNPSNVQLFEKIKKELTKLEKEGFQLQNEKNSFDIVTDRSALFSSARVSLYDNIIYITFFKDWILKTVYSNGDVYEGDFSGTTGKTVKGKYTWANGNVYEGDFVNDKMEGKGKMIWKSGSVYEGDFVDGRRTGKGKLIFENGNVYEGDFVNDKMEGKGKYTGKNGGSYIGDFKDGKFNGKGKLTKVDGTVYEGDFKDGKFMGKTD